MVKTKTGNVYRLKSDIEYKYPYLSQDLPIMTLRIHQGARVVLQRYDMVLNLYWVFYRAKMTTLYFSLTAEQFKSDFELIKHHNFDEVRHYE